MLVVIGVNERLLAVDACFGQIRNMFNYQSALNGLISEITSYLINLINIDENKYQ